MCRRHGFVLLLGSRFLPRYAFPLSGSSIRFESSRSLICLPRLTRLWRDNLQGDGQRAGAHGPVKALFPCYSLPQCIFWLAINSGCLVPASAVLRARSVGTSSRQIYFRETTQLNYPFSAGRHVLQGSGARSLQRNIQPPISGTWALTVPEEP